MNIRKHQNKNTGNIIFDKRNSLTTIKSKEI